MQCLPIEIFSCILENVLEIDFINFISACKHFQTFNKLKKIEGEYIDYEISDELLERYNFTNLYLFDWNNDYSIKYKSLTLITFDDDFDNVINNLPENLVYLKLGNNFTNSIDFLPSKLKWLEIGVSFNKPVNKLPQNLEILIINGEFNQNIDKLPSSLKRLELHGVNY